MRVEKIVLSILCIFCMVSFGTGCGESQFNGSKVSNENEFWMEYSAFNTTYEHNFELEQGDAIRCSVVADKGTVDISIHKGEEVNAYQGKDVPTGNFEVEIEEAGEYTITVTGNKAVGSVSFEKVQCD